MRYPSKFSSTARNRIEAEWIRASNEYDHAKSTPEWASDPGSVLRRSILRVFLVFAQEAGALGKAGVKGWSLDKIKEKCDEFLRQLTIHAFDEKGQASPVSSRISGLLDGRIVRWFQAAPEWNEYQGILLGVVSENECPDRAEKGTQSRTSSTVEKRIEEVTGYTHEMHCSRASLARAAKVDPSDLGKWMRGVLPSESDKVARIEKVLKDRTPPIPAPKKR